MLLDLLLVLILWGYILYILFKFFEVTTYFYRGYKLYIDIISTIFIGVTCYICIGLLINLYGVTIIYIYIFIGITCYMRIGLLINLYGVTCYMCMYRVTNDSNRIPISYAFISDALETMQIAIFFTSVFLWSLHAIYLMGYYFIIMRLLLIFMRFYEY